MKQVPVVVSAKEAEVTDMIDMRARVESGKEVGKLTFQSLLWFLSSIAITISSGIYLWGEGDPNYCSAPNYRSDLNNKANYVDVSKRFDDVLKIFFTLGIVDVVRQGVMLVAVIKQSSALATIYQVLVVNDVLGFGAIFVLHAFRFDMAGKICAGDHDDDVKNYPFQGNYLYEQGRYLRGLVYWIWIGGFLICLMSTCFALFQFKPLLIAFVDRIIVRPWKSVSIVARMKLANQNDLLNYQYVYQAAASLAIFVATASTLWTKEVDDTCSAPYYQSIPRSSDVDVDKRFRDVLKIWWTWGVIDFFRAVFALIAVNKNSLFFARVYQVLIINDFLGVIAVLMVHTYRFQYSGKYCSGDFLADDSQAVPGYLVLRGKFLCGLVIATWVGLLTWGFLMMTITTAASRRESGKVKAAVDDESKKLVVSSSSHKPYDLEI